MLKKLSSFEMVALEFHSLVALIDSPTSYVVERAFHVVSVCVSIEINCSEETTQIKRARA